MRHLCRPTEDAAMDRLDRVARLAVVGGYRSLGQAGADVAQSGHLRVNVQAQISPTRLLRSGSAPSWSQSAPRSPPPMAPACAGSQSRSTATAASISPACRSATTATCKSATTRGALQTCRDSLVGQGYFSSKLLLGASSKFPASSKLYAFNARLRGRPAIIAHVYGTEPVPTSYTSTFELHSSHGTFGAVMSASLADVGQELATPPGSR
jgi:hypothetical protein